MSNDFIKLSHFLPPFQGTLKGEVARVKEPEPQKDNAVTPAIRVGRSKGEKLFDWLVYGGLAGVVTFVLTLIPAYWMRYKGGEAKMGEWLGKAGVKGDLAKNILTTTSLSHGGNLMILPIAYAEARHTQIVDGLNRMTGDPTPVEEIQAKPKPTLGNILGARVLAWMAVFTGFVGFGTVFKETVATFEHEMGKRFCKVANVPRYYFAETIENGIKTMQRHESKTYRVGVISAQDIFATAAAATLLYVGGQFFSRKRKEVREQERGQLCSVNQPIVVSLNEPSAMSPNSSSPKATLFGERFYEGKSVVSHQNAAERSSAS